MRWRLFKHDMIGHVASFWLGFPSSTSGIQKTSKNAAMAAFETPKQA